MTFQYFNEYHKLLGLWATDLLVIPCWNTSGRPSGSDLQANILGINTDVATNPIIEWYDGTTWRQPSVVETDPIYSASFVSGISSIGSHLTLTAGVLDANMDWTSLSGKPNSGNFIYNQNSSVQSSADFWISGTGRATGFTADNSSGFYFPSSVSAPNYTGVFYTNDDILSLRGWNRVDLVAGTTVVQAYSGGFDIYQPVRLYTPSSRPAYSTGGYSLAVVNSTTNLLEITPATTSSISEGSNLYYTDTRARAAINAGTGIAYDSSTGVISSTITQYTDVMARAAISLTTTGTSGAATYNNSTGVLNIPQYAAASGSGSYIQNQNAAAQTSSNFWISGKGIVGGTTDNGFSLQVTGFSSFSPRSLMTDGKLQIGDQNGSTIQIWASRDNYLNGSRSLWVTAADFTFNTYNGSAYTTLVKMGGSYTVDVTGSVRADYIYAGTIPAGLLNNMRIVSSTGIQATDANRNTIYMWISGGYAHLDAYDYSAGAIKPIMMSTTGLVVGGSTYNSSYMLDVVGSARFTQSGSYGLTIQGSTTSNSIIPALKLVGGGTLAPASNPYITTGNGGIELNLFGASGSSTSGTLVYAGIALRSNLANSSMIDFYTESVVQMKLLQDKLLVGYTASQGSYTLQSNGSVYVNGDVVGASDMVMGIAGSAGTNTLQIVSQAGTKGNGGAIALAGGGATTNPNTIVFYTNGGEAMRVLPSSYLLIGYTTSQGTYKLQVNGGAYVSSTTIIPAYFTGSDASGVSVIRVANTSGSVDIGRFGSDFGIQVNGGTSFRWTSDGKLLLGYTTSQGSYNLQVNGGAYLNGTINLPTAPATYATGGYDVLVRNQTTKNIEITTISGGGGSGTVTSFGFTNGNGFIGSVTNSTTTPTLSLTTGVTDKQVMYSSSGAIAGNSNFTFDSTTNRLSVLGDYYANSSVTDAIAGKQAAYFQKQFTWTSNPGSWAAGAGFQAATSFSTETFGSNITLNAATVHSAQLNILRVGTTAASAVVIGQASTGSRRAMSANSAMVQLDTQSASTWSSSVDHVAGVQIFAPQALGSAVASNLLINITNYYGVLIGASDEYTNSGTKITNKYGIYQSGFNDMNFFAGTKNKFGDTANGAWTIPTSALDVNGAHGYDQLRLRNSYTPTSSSDANGNTGDIAWDDNYIYIKVSTGWKRTSLTTF